MSQPGYTEIPMRPPASPPTPTGQGQYRNRLSVMLIILNLVLLVFFIYHMYTHAYAHNPFLHHHDRHLHRSSTTSSQLFSSASDDCTTEQRSACYGVVSQSLFTATRRCGSGLVATTCRCMSPDGATLESYGLQNDGECQCTFATRRPQKTTWVMWLLCFNTDPREKTDGHRGRGNRDRVQPAKLPTFGRIKEAYA